MTLMKENKLYSLHVSQAYAGCNWQTCDINVEQLTVVENRQSTLSFYWLAFSPSFPDLIFQHMRKLMRFHFFSVGDSNRFISSVLSTLTPLLWICIGSLLCLLT